ncbi:flippase [Lactobacillus acidophilus]|uniref:flippase n=1 Tax=Lactobacillus acidophilus TaxID=1579 RepID=UPI0021A8BFFE|nr:flippase [Lactobacillus acidophilus]MCT3602861.1 flippase [Lactobacillus acidophilus]MCT3623321.1 flippase [Lactobacillus acidophilus]
MKKKSLGLNGLLNGLRSALNLVFPLITFPYVTRILSVNGIGIYNFSSTYVGYFVLIAGLGISTYSVREGAKYRDNKEEMGKFASQIFSINILSTILAYILLIGSLIIFSNLKIYISSILIFSLQIFFTTIGTEWIYIIYEDYAYITVRSIIFKIISIILLFVLVKNRQDYLWYAAITVFSSVGSNVLNFINAKKICNIRLTTNIDWKYHIKPILTIFATTIAVNIYLSSDTTLLGLLKSDYAVGIYSTAVKIYTLVATLLGSVVSVTIPRLAMLMGKRKTKEYNKIFTKVMSSLSLFVVPGTIGLIMLSKNIVLLIAGEKYLPSVNSLRIIGLAIIFSNYSFIFSNCALIPAKREMLALKNTVITAIINIILNIILIPLFSYDGTSFSTVVAEFLTMILNFWSSRDLIGKTVFSKKVICDVRDSLISSIGIIVICIICNIAYSSLYSQTILAIIFSIIIYACMLIALKNEMAMKYLEIIKSKLK